ncbi:MAG: hypothetical protein N838_17970 [Thiohalocapsa sp. PB-PSB1]|nr:MAG: hypothetical protein N838_17970 [Thiohalocapsa sp. PB-PSB1]
MTLTDNVGVNWPWTLEIAPGTVVRAPASVGLTINSSAKIIGAADQPIRLQQAGDAEGTWGGVDFGSASVSGVVRHTWISDADRCIDIADGVHLIVDNVLAGCAQAGIYIDDGDPIIENNLIVENGDYGIRVGTYARSSIRHNTIDRNGAYGLYFTGSNGAGTVVENNLITRNGGYGWYQGSGVTRGHNNVWGNATDYSSAGTIPESHIASDPLYLDPFFGDRRLLDGSPSLTAGSDGDELGAYGAGGSPPDYDPQIEAGTPTTAGALTGHERWSGEVVLTDTVSVDWPWRLELAPGTVVRGPAGAEIQIKGFTEGGGVVSSADAPWDMSPVAGYLLHTISVDRIETRCP